MVHRDNTNRIQTAERHFLMKVFVYLCSICFWITCNQFTAFSQDEMLPSKNKPERIEWFMDAGQGLFIHWSMDSQLGSVISHSMVGASEDYLDRFINVLPKTFNPKRFDPEEWAVLAKLAGFQYVVFTTKHHSGFCMFDTKTTNFNIMNTPYARDITAELVTAFRKYGIAIGFYYSPDDFYFLHKQGTTISRRRPGVAPHENPELLAYDQAQMRELLTNYGKIDVMFIDGPAKGLTEICWELQPDIVVTRGVMNTPEQRIPGEAIPGPWEACLTMGTQWQYKPTNEDYKSGTKGIEMLIETRAKGGNLLYNIGPKPNGEIPIEQEERLRELALWHFVNGESIQDIRPWVVTNEDELWFTKKKNDSTVYVHVTNTDWKYGEEKTFVIKSIGVTPYSEITVLGQSGDVLEYQPARHPQTTWYQDEQGLHITATRAQRLYNDKTWPNPVVFKITNVQHDRDTK
jgi:alpha-L-fucosidase